MGKVKYKTEEERVAAKREAYKRWYLKNRESELERKKQWREDNPEYNKQYSKQWREDNKERIAEYKKQWREDNKERIKQHYLDNKERIAEYGKQYREDNKEQIAEYGKQWREDNPEYNKQYIKTPIGRANILLCAYRQSDKDQNRGECTLTTQWIVDNIFSKPCHYCGETDWKKLGCDRVDNSKPHTPDNVVPCCCECNRKKARYTYDEYIEMIKRFNFS